jgi:hypothetical protein
MLLSDEMFSIAMIVFIICRVLSDLLAVMTQARQEIRIWRSLTQRHMGVRERTVT